MIPCKTTKNEAFGEAPVVHLFPVPMMCLILVSPTLTTWLLNESKSVPPGNYGLRMGISNEVKFQVLPATPEWQAEQLASLLALLDADHTKDAPSDIERTKRLSRQCEF